MADDPAKSGSDEKNPQDLVPANSSGEAEQKPKRKRRRRRKKKVVEVQPAGGNVIKEQVFEYKEEKRDEPQVAEIPEQSVQPEQKLEEQLPPVEWPAQGEAATEQPSESASDQHLQLDQQAQTQQLGSEWQTQEQWQAEAQNQPQQPNDQQNVSPQEQEIQQAPPQQQQPEQAAEQPAAPQPPEPPADFSPFASEMPAEDTSPINPFAEEEVQQPKDEEPDDRPINPFEEFEPAQPAEVSQAATEAPKSPFAEDEVVDVHQDHTAEDEHFPESSNDDLHKGYTEVVEPEIIQRSEVPRENLASAADISNVETPHKPLGNNDDFKENFWDILEHAGVTPRRIGVFVIVVLAIILGLIVYGWFSEDEGNVNQSPNEEQSEDQEPPESIDSSGVIGDKAGEGGNIDGLLTGFDLGQQEGLKQENFARYMELLRGMQNIFDVDVYTLLDRSVDRRAVLEKHLKDISQLIQEASSIVTILDSDLDRIEREYDLVNQRVDELEQSFFTNMDELKGFAAGRDLQLFIEFSQQAAALKADFNAKRNIQDMLLNSLTFLEPRYQDISVNEEALIKGVRVFDVPDSDINAIIRLEPRPGSVQSMEVTVEPDQTSSVRER